MANELEGLAERLRWAVEQARPPITQGKLAERLGVSSAAISLWLNAKRSVPDDAVEKIARVTRVEPGWLATGSGNPRDERETEESETSVEETRPELVWGGRPAPRDGKDFGNAGVYATPPDTATKIREDGQNTLDAALDDGSGVGLRFRVIELNPTSRRYNRFFEAIRWDQLSAHISAVAESGFESKLGNKVVAARARINRREKIVLVSTDDFGARGLNGDDFDSKKPFAALVRDNLNSQKADPTAGGVFGVGSKQNVACSGLSTVAYATQLPDHPGRTRVIARAELPYHEIEDEGKSRRYAGPAWLGQVEEPSRDGEDPLTVSVWLDDDDPLLEDLLLKREAPPGWRPDRRNGTSIMVVDFIDPDAEGAPNTAHLVEEFARAAAENFWPAMMRGDLTVWVERYVDDEEAPSVRKQVDPREYVAPFCDAWEKHAAGDTVGILREPGDVAEVSIPLAIPATRSDARNVFQHEEVQSECRLVVRLADPELPQDPHLNDVGYTRGRAMVVRYISRPSIVLGARPYHAFLLAGTIVADTPEQRAAEQFLRISEPPAHNRWIYRSEMGEKYRLGGGARLEDMEKAVRAALQHLVSPAVSASDEGPESVKRLLQLRGPRRTQRDILTAKVLTVAPVVRNGAWHIEAEVSVNPSPKVIEVVPHLGFLREGSSAVRVAWDSLELMDGTAELDGDRFVLKPRTKRFRFRGISDPTSHPVEAARCAAQLNLHTSTKG
jgi:transcriptional regulator with XRE-family HTH domain